MKIIYGFISLMIITSFVLSLTTFFKVRSLESQISTIESFLDVATTQQQGTPSAYAQYVQLLQVKK